MSNSMNGSNAKKRSSRPKEYDVFLKIVLVGRSYVGKSSLMIRFIDGTFNDFYVNTIGVDFRFKTIMVKDRKVKVQIWDTAGQEKFRTITSTYYKGADAILLVYDITNRESFDDINNYWIHEIEKNGSEVQNLILIGNKADLEAQRLVPKFTDSVYKFDFNGFKREAKVYEVSAKTDDGIVQIFEQLAMKYIMQREAKKLGKSILATQKDQPLAAIKELEEEDGEGSRGSGREERGEDKSKNGHLARSGSQEDSEQRLSKHKFNEKKQQESGCNC